MSSDLEFRKAELRKRIRAEVGRLSAAGLTAGGEQICARLKQQPIWQRARTILFFAPMPGEPDIWPLLGEAIQQGKTAALPFFDPPSGVYEARRVQDVKKDVASGQFGILEPHSYCTAVPLNGLDLVLVPGIGYDVYGHRLGRGKGYYDRLLSDVGGFKCGIAFDAQIVAEIPTGAHDIHLNCILTPARWIET